MQKPQQSRFRYKVSSWHIIVLVYCLALGALGALIFSEKQRTSFPVSMTHASFAESRGSTALLSLRGERMHDKVRILHAARMVDDRPFQLEILPGASVRAVAVKERFALVACFRSKLVSVDLSTPGGPTLLGSLEMPGFINEIVISGTRALVGMARGGGVAIVDFGKPEELHLVNHFPSEGSIVDMVAAGDQVFFVDKLQGLGRIRQVGENSSPEILDTLDSPWRIAVSGDRMVVASLYGRMGFYELSEGGTIHKVGSMNFPGLEKGGIRGIAFAAESLAVALSDGSMRVFPISSWPKLIDDSRLTIPGAPYKVVPIPGRSQVAVGLVSSGIALVEIPSSGNAVVSGHLMLPMTNIAMDVTADKIYFSRQGGRQGLVAFDIKGIKQSAIDPASHFDRNYYALYAWNGRLFGYRRDKSLVALADVGDCGSSSAGPILLVHDEDGVSMFRMQENGEVSKAGSIVVEDRALDAVHAEGYLHVLHPGGLRILSETQTGEMLVTGDLELSGQPVHLKFLEQAYLLVTTRRRASRLLTSLIESILYRSRK